MKTTQKYYSELRSDAVESRIVSMLKDMPGFASDFMAQTQDRYAPSTRLAYLRDIRSFLTFLTAYVNVLNGKEIKDVTLLNLSRVDDAAILSYMDQMMKKDDQNGPYASRSISGAVRKVKAVRAMYQHFIRIGALNEDPTMLVDFPTVTTKEEHVLTESELKALMDEILYGTHLSKRQMEFHDMIVRRDMAIIHLLVTTGLTLTELTDLRYGDVRFSSPSLTTGRSGIVLDIHRKDGSLSQFQLSDETAGYIQEYITNERNVYFDLLTQENDPLFLSIRGDVMTPSTVQKMMLRYTAPLFGDKRISCATLRHTCAANLYHSTGDKKLVSERLGRQLQSTRKSLNRTD